MLTPPDMLTNKIRPLVAKASLVLLVGCLTGCGSSGPRSLLDGSRLLKKGQPAAAAVRFEEAVEQMPTNAMAWAYLAVAHHESGKLSSAEPAYRQALQLKPDLVESRFGLGMLYWQRGQWTEAREQFAAVTVLQPDRAPAWLRLGECQCRLSDTRSALMSLSRAVTLDSKSAEAWNWLGLAQVLAGQARDAESSFQRALDQQMNHAPALLNLAVLRQQQLNRPRDALDLYRQYLAFWPSAANAAGVRTVALQLEQQLAPAPPPPAPAQAVKATPARKVEAIEPTAPRPAPVVSRVAAPPPAASQRPPPSVPAAKGSVASAEPSRPETSAGRAPAPAPTTVEGAGTTAGTPPPAPARKRSLLSKLNPVNLLKGGSENQKVTPLPRSGAGSTASTPGPAAAAPSEGTGAELVSGATRFPRYAYRSTWSFAEGDAAAAERLCREAERLRLRGQLAQAAERSQAAILANPASYEAHFNLGLVALQSGEMAQALSGFEAATALRPDSDVARYNLGLALKQAGFPVDAAGEMQRLLQQDPGDVRAHLMLGNLYDRPFGDKSRARKHYLRVLEIAPAHPEAVNIRFWLKQNPP